MTLNDFLEKLEETGGDLLYLSTQESANDHAKFQVPCQQLLDHGHIAESVPWAGNLILHSCNLVSRAVKLLGVLVCAPFSHSPSLFRACSGWESLKMALLRVYTMISMIIFIS